MQIDAARFLAGGERFVAHSAFADHTANAEFSDDLSLVRLLANRSRRACRCHLPIALLVLQHHRPAVIQNALAQVRAHRQLAAFVQIFVHRVAAREHHAGNENFIANFQRADFGFGKREFEFDHVLSR